MQYSYEFKVQAVEKALGEDPMFLSIPLLKAHCINHSTLRRWVARFQNQPYAEENMSKEKTPRQWTPEQKLQAVIDCESMDQSQVSAYLQQAGNLPASRRLLEKGSTESSPSTRASEQGENTAAHRGVTSFAQEAAAKKRKGSLGKPRRLLILKKKVDQLWETDEVELTVSEDIVESNRLDR